MYKYTRKQWLKKYYELPDGAGLNRLLLELLETKQETSRSSKKTKTVQTDNNIENKE